MKENVRILGIPIHPVRPDELRGLFGAYVADQKQHIIATVNPEFIIEAQKNQSFKKILNSTDLNVADGIGILWAAKYLKLAVDTSRIRTRVGRVRYRKAISVWQCFYSLLAVVFYPRFVREVIPARISGMDVLNQLVDITSTGDYSMYLLGGKKGVAAAAKIELEQKFPQAVITGAKSGYLRKGEAEDSFVKAVNRAKPDILIVALGSPRQEQWIWDNLKNMESVKIAVGVGGVLDYVSRKKMRAPRWMQIFGLEWLFRLACEPGRFPRIKNATWVFVRNIVDLKSRGWA